jgi:phosphatidate cytidylyltransferase
MLRQRIITAIILGPIVLACVFLLPHFEFSLFVGGILTVAAWEWANFANLSKRDRYLYAMIVGAFMFASYSAPVTPVLLLSSLWWMIAVVLVANYPKLDELWGSPVVIMVIGVITLVPGFVALIELKGRAESNFLICLLLFLIWGADIGAYFTGRALGKRKLAPRVSPGKSWAGVYGGVLTSFVIAMSMSLYVGRPQLVAVDGVIFLAACMFIAVVSILGDLTISMFKRHRDIKDSSNLLPGHGGVLDRIDSLLSASPVFALYLGIAVWAGNP